MFIVNSNQMKQIDSNTINNFGIPGIVLMENAALAVVREVKEVLLKDEKSRGLNKKKAVIMVGKGNNGGDGLAIARHLLVLGMEVTVFLFALPEDLKGDAETNYNFYKKMDGKIVEVENEKQVRLFRLALLQAQVVIDALYGTGFKGALPDQIAKYVIELNKFDLPVIAVDIASGLEANTGKVRSIAVKAQTTVTFGLAKLGHYLGDGPIYSGKLVVDRISIPEQIIAEEKISTFVLTKEIIKPLIPERHPQGHKGTHGTGILIGGSTGMSGAMILAGKAALRCGIGLLQIVTPQDIAGTVDAEVTEATVWPSKDKDMLGEQAAIVIEERLQAAKACALGPGLRQNEDFLPVMENILKESTVPLVLDADALNLLAQNPSLLGSRKGKASIIITPHPGEMARLCQCTVSEVQENRMEMALAKALEWGVIVVLKGANTVIASPDGRVFFNPTGNAGLGAGGTGDVLTGSIMSWLTQGVPPLGAACLGVYLHGLAADVLKESYGLSGFTASEVADLLPRVRREIEILK